MSVRQNSVFSQMQSLAMTSADTVVRKAQQANGARSEAILFDPPYVKLIAGHEQATGDSAPLHRMVVHLRHLIARGSPYAGEYKQVLPQLEYATALRDKLEAAAHTSDYVTIFTQFVVPYSRVRAHQLAKEIKRHLVQHRSTLIPSHICGHAILMEFRQEAASGNGVATYSIRIYNTGRGTSNHTVRDGTKIQTMYVVRGVHLGPGPNNINVGQIANLLFLGFAARHRWQKPAADHAYSWFKRNHPRDASRAKAAEYLYQWAMQKGTPDNPPNNTVQAPQKFGTCTHKCIMAFLRNNLSDVAFSTAKATLLEDATAAFASSRMPAMALTTPKVAADMSGLAQLLQRKSHAARIKAQAAEQVVAICARAAAQPWFLPEGAHVSQRMAAHSTRSGPGFVLRYAPDARTFIVTCKWRDDDFQDQVADVPLVLDRVSYRFTWAQEQRTFGSLDACARWMQKSGWVACGG